MEKFHLEAKCQKTIKALVANHALSRISEFNFSRSPCPASCRPSQDAESHFNAYSVLHFNNGRFQI